MVPGDERELVIEKGERSLDEWRSCCWLDRVKIGFGVEPKYSFGCTCTGVGTGVKSKVRDTTNVFPR